MVDGNVAGGGSRIGKKMTLLGALEDHALARRRRRPTFCPGLRPRPIFLAKADRLAA
jgi:hypothetical protein